MEKTEMWALKFCTEGYWVGRVVLGFFICRKHSGEKRKKRKNQLHAHKT